MNTIRPASLLRTLLRLVVYAFLGLGVIWLFGAIRYNGPFATIKANTVLAAAWLLALIAVFGLLPRRPARWCGALLAALVLIPWSLIQPSNDRDWKPEFGRTGWSEIEGDRVTLHETRNFDYTPDGQVTERWETRVVHLSKLRGVDLFLDTFMAPWVAHPIASFDFGEDGHVALSIETRRENSENFSMLGGLYKMFELQYIFGDERDFVRVRTNIRHEPVYLYKLVGNDLVWREFFLESLRAQNELHQRPRFYNVLTANCTTSLRAQKPAAERKRLDIRLLLNGKMDEMLHERGVIAADNLPFAELRKLGHINDKANAAHEAADFSERVRVGVPGFH